MQGPSTGKLNKAVRRKPAERAHDVFTRVVPWVYNEDGAKSVRVGGAPREIRVES